MDARLARLHHAVFGRNRRAVLVGGAVTAVLALAGGLFQTSFQTTFLKVLLAALAGSTVASSMAVSNWGDGATVGARATAVGYVLYRLVSSALFFVAQLLATGDVFAYWTLFNSTLLAVVFLPVFVVVGVVGGVLGATLRRSRGGTDAGTA